VVKFTFSHSKLGKPILLKFSKSTPMLLNKGDFHENRATGSNPRDIFMGRGGNGCNLHYLRAGSETMVYIYATIAQARNQGGSPPRKHGPLVGPP